MITAEQEVMWNTLKYKGSTQVWFHGNGKATHFPSAWIVNAKILHVLVDDVAQSEFRDYVRDGSTIRFRRPVPQGHTICVTIYEHAR